MGEDFTSRFDPNLQYSLNKLTEYLKVRICNDLQPVSVAIVSEVIAQVLSLNSNLPLQLFDMPKSPPPWSQDDLAEYTEDLMVQFPTIEISLKELIPVKSIFVKVIAPHHDKLVIATRRNRYFLLSQTLTITYYAENVGVHQEAASKDIRMVLNGWFTFVKNLRGCRHQGQGWDLLVNQSLLVGN
jgi:hypothetical protein